MIKENKDPTFIEQAFAIIEETYSIPGADQEHGMKIGDHKLLCRILNAHEDYIDEKIVKKFIKEVAEHYQPISDSLEEFRKDIAELKLIHKLPIEFDKRLKSIEIYKSPFWTITRNLITAAFAIGIALILFFQIMNNRLERIEKKIEEHINKTEQVK